MVKNSNNSTPLLDQVIDLAPAITVSYNLNTGNYLYVSNSIHTILGYKKEQFLKNGTAFAYSLMHPDDAPRIQKESQNAMRYANKRANIVRTSKPFVMYEYRMKHKNGSWIWLRTSVAILSRGKKGIVENLVSTSIDVTLWKEAALQAEEKLRQSEEQYRIVVENTRDVIMAIDMQGKVLYASPANEKLLGYKPKESLGSFAFDIVHPDDRADILKAFSEVSKNHNRTFVYRVKHKDGHYITVEGSGSVVYDSKNNPYMFVGIARDVTQRIQYEKQKDTFIAIASHELKTPVTSLKAYAQLLHRDFTNAGNNQAALYLAKMNVQLDKLSSLINDLLDVAKIEEGKLQFSREQFDFNELVLEIIEEMQRITEQHTIIKKLRTTRMIFGDRERIGQVLTNLLSNAIKYSPDSDTIIVTTRAGKKNITVSVQDFGVGISEENQKRVFERFYRGTDSRPESYPGLGLGLFISSEIVKRHSGTIAVRSKKGEGTTFSFSLPCGEPPFA